MVKVTGNVAKCEIANAIQNYNGAEIYSYYNTMLPFRHCYHVNDNECDIKEFCKIVEKSVKEKVNENGGLPLNMIIIYTNESDLENIGILTDYAISNYEHGGYVGTVVLMTR